MRLRRKPEPKPEPQAQPQGQAQTPRWKKAQREIAQLRRRVSLLEKEVQELRQLNKRVAEVTDVVAEVLLPAENRDEARLREILGRYESSL